MALTAAVETSVAIYVLGLCLFAAGFVGIEYFGSSDFVKTGFPLIALNIGGYNADHFIGVVVGTVALPLAGSALSWGAWMSRFTFKSTFIHLVLASLHFAFSSVMYGRWKGSNLIDCGFALCAIYGPDKKRGDTANGFFQMIAVPMFFFFVWIGCYHVATAITILKGGWTTNSPVVESDDDSLTGLSSSNNTTPLLANVQSKLPNATELHSTYHTRITNLKACVKVLLILLIGFGASILLPNGWLNWTAHKIRVNAIEVVDGESAFRDFKFGFVTRPELPDAVFRTWTFRVSNDVIAKVYPDVYIFYSYLAIVTLAVRLVRSYLLKFIVFTAVSMAALACFVHSWWYHNWHGWWGGVEGFIVHEPSHWEKLARTGGQVASAMLGVLLTLTGRQSSLVHLAEVSWERAIVLHRWIANLFLVVVLGHIAAWWMVFREQGVFPHDAIAGALKSAPTFFPLNAHAKPGHCKTLQCLDPEYNKPAADNFTIPLMNFVTFYIIIPVFVVATWHRIRRTKFEVFYFAHATMSLVLVLAVFWHAAASLVFLLPGLIVIAWDRIGRTVTSSIERRVSEIRVASDGSFVHLVLEPPLESFTPGQFIKLNIPKISAFQFHPFSLSSATGLSIHAKCIGDFTQDIAKCVKKGDMALVEGPYGLPPCLKQRSRVIFIAGGIGITPIASMIDSLLNRPMGQPLQLFLIWVARGGSICLFSEFSQLIELASSSPNLNCIVNIKLFDPERPASSSTVLAGYDIPVKGGRPNLDEEVARFVADFKGPEKDPPLIFACGPSELIQRSREVAVQFGCEFHDELFEI